MAGVSFYNLPAVSAANLLLDDYPNAAAAYSLRLIRKTYSGSAIRVRRASDNAEQDIGFTANNLDTPALISFCTGTNGFVTTWYDQSGNARNATQVTAASQPKIYDSATGVVISNGKATIDFDGINDFLLNSTINITQPITSFWAAKSTTKNPAVFFDSNVTNRFVHYIGAGAINFIISYDNTGANISLPFNTNYNLFYALANAISSEFAINGQTATTGNPGTYGLSSLRIGDIRATISISNYHLEGTMNELIIYPSDQSSNRTGIESNINNYYNIYP